MTRLDTLALKAAQALEFGNDPFSSDFLVEHEVTADECFGLSARMALALRIFQGLSANDRAIAAARSVLPEEMAQEFEAQVRLNAARKTLRDAKAAAVGRMR